MTNAPNPWSSIAQEASNQLLRHAQRPMLTREKISKPILPALRILWPTERNAGPASAPRLKREDGKFTDVDFFNL